MRLGGDDTGDLVAHGEPRHALAERIDLARVVLADHDGVSVLHHAPGHALRDNTSNPFTEEARTFTRTSPGPGSGVGTSITAAGAPSSVSPNAFMLPPYARATAPRSRDP